MKQFSRTELLIGNEKANRLYNSSVAIFGLGGVGSYVAEALARAGVGKIMLVDNDKVDKSNINRQLVATHSTLNKNKVDVMCDRILDINPNAIVLPKVMFYDANSADKVELSQFDYVVDAIDTVSSKLLLIKTANLSGVDIISAMGAGNKLNATAFKVADIYQTKGCPLARVMRRELKQLNIKSLKVVYSEEKAIKPDNDYSLTDNNGIKNVTASISYVPPVMGFIIAGEVIKDIAFNNVDNEDNVD